LANAILNRSSVVAFTWNNQEGWPVEFVTENVENLLGYTAKEFLSGEVSYADCVHEDDLERVGDEVKSFSEEKGRLEFSHLYWPLALSATIKIPLASTCPLPAAPIQHRGQASTSTASLAVVIAMTFIPVMPVIIAEVIGILDPTCIG
jgi:hypothetical protein